MDWNELADLPFAAALMPHAGVLAAGEDYDSAHFDQCVVDGAAAPGSRFLECAFTGVSFLRGQLRQARFGDVWMREVQLTGTDLAESAWTTAVITNSSLAGVEAFGAQLRAVLLRGCKLDSVNFRGAALTDVTFSDCLLRDVDFSGASLSRTAFPGSRLTGTDFTKVAMQSVDLRAAELGITIDPGSLRGAIVTPGQLADMAALLADTLGIMVEELPSPG